MPAVSVEYRNMYYPETELSNMCCPLVTKKCGTGKGPIAYYIIQRRQTVLFLSFWDDAAEGRG